MTTMLENYTFNQSGAVDVTPYGMDVIIVFLFIITVCQLFQVFRYFFWRRTL